MGPSRLKRRVGVIVPREKSSTQRSSVGSRSERSSGTVSVVVSGRDTHRFLSERLSRSRHENRLFEVRPLRLGLDPLHQKMEPVSDPKIVLTPKHSLPVPLTRVCFSVHSSPLGTANQTHSSFHFLPPHSPDFTVSPTLRFPCGRTFSFSPCFQLIS